ncbi:hypothetical protein [Enterobacter phage 04_vB_Eclo_IJM]|nr:hypothetical protein [Enterobacter phage 04_vB_Eclo_IJM]
MVPLLLTSILSAPFRTVSLHSSRSWVAPLVCIWLRVSA